MPRIKRWFPVSHDINSDPEVWELTESLGDRSLRVWLELLSIADRNEGEIRGERKYLQVALSSKLRTTFVKVSSVVDFALAKGWLKLDGSLRVANYAKYHRTEERKKLPSGNGFRSRPDLTRPDLTPLTPLTPLSGNGTRSHAPEKGGAVAAWEEVVSLISPVGRHRKPQYSSQAIESAVLAIGGWNTICDSQNLDSTKRQFFSAYNKITSETKP